MYGQGASNINCSSVVYIVDVFRLSSPTNLMWEGDLYERVQKPRSTEVEKRRNLVQLIM